MPERPGLLSQRPPRRSWRTERPWTPCPTCCGPGWLAGLRDPLVCRVLGLLHRQPARAWTLETLAREAAVSRSVLAERFAHFVGQPPMQYLARWRMQVAARRLADGAVKVGAVGLEVGYDSEAAFSRAFKKAVGVSPAAWRVRQQASGWPSGMTLRTRRTT